MFCDIGKKCFVHNLRSNFLQQVHITRPSTIIEESTFYNSSNEESKALKSNIIREVGDTLEIIESESSEVRFEDHISLNNTNIDSFETAKLLDTTFDLTSYETANDQTLTGTTKAFSDLSVFPFKKKRNFYDASFAKSLSISTASDNSLLNVKYEKNSVFLDSVDVIEVSSKECTKETNVDNDSLQEDSFLLNDENSSDVLQAPDFNDTLEEMDFIMKHGMKFLEQKVCSQLKSPTVLKEQTLNTKSHLSDIKATPDYTTRKNASTTFKKPKAISRLPVLKSNSKKYNHIISPIQAYINDAPQYPLIAKQKGSTGLIDRLHDPNRRDTVFSQSNENLFSEDPTYRSVIPLKGVISMQKSQIYDARTPIKMPGGEKVHKLIGSHTPTVIKHEGHFKSYAIVPINADDTIDDSFANLSVASGDVSIQIVKNVNRV